jgi:hypothetical protein
MALYAAEIGGRISQGRRRWRGGGGGARHGWNLGRRQPLVV